MRVYLAARYAWMLKMAEVGDQMKALGFDITSQWIYYAEEGKTREENAVMDLEDVRRADALVCYTFLEGTPIPGGGRHSEFGMAYAWGKKVYIVGPREQIFHWLPGVTQFDTTEQMIVALCEEAGLDPFKNGWFETGSDDD
jgi:hypothetical protein